MSNNLILVINDGVSKGRSLASSVVASVPSVTFIALRTLRALRWMETPLWTFAEPIRWTKAKAERRSLYLHQRVQLNSGLLARSRVSTCRAPLYETNKPTTLRLAIYSCQEQG